MAARSAVLPPHRATLMRLHALILAAFLPVAAAQPPPAGDNVETPLERLFSERDSLEKFDATVAAARGQGTGEQALLEARFLFHVDRHEDEAIAALLPDFEKRAASFKLEESEIFSTTEDWLAVFEYVKAIAALGKGDKAAFKKHITEAFWLSPRQGAAFAPHIDRLRLDEAMSAVKIDFAVKLPSLFSPDPVELSTQLGANTAVLFHFWSPWSRECEATLPDFVTTAAELLSKNIGVISILPENTPEVVTDAREILKPLGASPPGAWLVDHKQHSLGRLLRIQTVPTMVLVAADGSILFNGHPADENFWNSLLKTSPSVNRPASSPDPDEP